MNKKLKDTKVTVGNCMTLAIKEIRGTSSITSFKEGYEETASETRTSFHWELHGVASKLGADEVESDDFDPKKQEIYDVSITSQGFSFGFGGFKSRDDAIRNAVEFAKRNEIDVDGYRAKAEKKG